MGLSLRRYSLMLFVQLGFIVIDLIINTLADCIRKYNVFLLVIYLFQDVCIIFAIITLVLSYFSTYQFQAGMVDTLFMEDRVTIMVTLCYLLLTICWQYLSLNSHWDFPNGVDWSTGMIVLFITQRTCCVFYYYLYKKSTLLLSNPKLYAGFIGKPFTIENVEYKSISRIWSWTKPNVNKIPTSTKVPVVITRF